MRDYQGYEERLASGVRRRELPHGGVLLVINFAAAWRVADPRRQSAVQRYGSFVAGVDDFASLVDCAGRAHCLQVNFTPIGARRCFGVPMDGLARRVVSLNNILGRDAERLADRLFQAKDWADRFDIAETFITARLRATAPADAGALWAWRKIEREGGGSSIASLARELDCSRKHLVARFRDQIGLPPKSIAGLVRFNRALAMIGAARKPDLARIAAAAGYFDQPHFNRDFATLAGITPGEFLRARLGRRRRRRRLNASGNIRTRYAPFSAAHWRRINQERSLMSKPGNRPNVFPALKYQNAKQAIDLLVNAFGFEKSAVHAGDGDMVAHAELKLGAGTVMLGSDAKNRRTRGTRCASASTCRSTTSRPITPAPRRPAPGSGGLWPIPITARECSAYDSEGNLWSFGTYHPDDK